MDGVNLAGYLRYLYDYHYWANARILNAIRGISQEQLVSDHGHSWGSLRGVLLHMQNAEWIWLQRWQGVSPTGFPSEEEYPTLADLRERWRGLEGEVRAFVAAQTPESILRDVSYANTRDKSFRLPLWQMMVHVPNHGTHHRGELAAMLAGMGIAHPEEDYLHYFLENG